MEPCRNCGNVPGDPYCRECAEDAFDLSPGFLRTSLMEYFGGWEEKGRAKALCKMVRTMPDWAKWRRERRDRDREREQSCSRNQPGGMQGFSGR